MSEIVFDLKVNMDNASFYDNRDSDFANVYQLKSILIQAAKDMDEMDHLAPGDEGICRDYNGNTVGKWIVSKNNSPQI